MNLNALTKNWHSPELGFKKPTMSSFGMGVHPGAQAFFRGEEMKLEPTAES